MNFVGYDYQKKREVVEGELGPGWSMDQHDPEDDDSDSDSDGESE